MDDLERQAFVRKMITENDYLSLATTDGEEPWVAPVEYTVDDELNFYFISFEGSRHMQHIAQNPTVAFAIFDSQQPPMTGEGIQVLGDVTTFSPEMNPFVTFGKYPEHPQDLADIDPNYVAYRITPVVSVHLT